MERQSTLMLQQLIINNYKLIDSLHIDFNNGLTILTGETGAGKSILLDAIKLILGDRGSPSLIKNNESPLIVEAQFSTINKEVITLLGTYDIETENNELHIYRKIDKDGKNVIRINGLPVNVKILKEIGENLIDLCSQHQHQSLFSKSNHKLILDNFGGHEIASLKAAVEQERTQYIILKNKYNDLNNNLQNIEKEKGFITYQINEIEEAGLKPDEENYLILEKQKLENATTLSQESSQALKKLSDTDEYIRKSLSHLVTLSKIDENITSAKSLLETAVYSIEEVIRDLSDYNEKIEYSPEALIEIDDRLFLINKLKRKYGPLFSDVMNTYNQLKSDYEKFTLPENDLDYLVAELSKLEASLAKHAAELSTQRKKVAVDIEKLITHELDNLMLQHSTFSVSIMHQDDEDGINVGSRKTKLYPDGIDDIEFLFSANPGTPPGELKDIVSGGELSRVMLALKTIFIKSGTTPTIIFDEIDTGVSGNAAAKIAQKIKELSRNFQVICVTHLAIIAAQGNTHILVNKLIEKDHTVVTTEVLEEKNREEEIARLLGGTQLSITFKHAQELLKSVENY
ncbi:MAG TPA: DNA repair protein RecN [Candidatus Margulisbacteria bacterium]|nr:DNA repair protein RecN [Candidatus Margulisiibacteriota bacterium]